MLSLSYFILSLPVPSCCYVMFSLLQTSGRSRLRTSVTCSGLGAVPRAQCFLVASQGNRSLSRKCEMLRRQTYATCANSTTRIFISFRWEIQCGYYLQISFQNSTAEILLVYPLATTHNLHHKQENVT